jgi:glycosyltransferase involved in cell wall biosynthesis
VNSRLSVPSYIVQMSAVEKAPREETTVEYQPISTATPLFSVIIAVHNDWVALDACLRSLAQQTQGPSFEVIVVDDGSSEIAPEAIREWTRHLPLTIVRQSHAGIPTARNRGIPISKGSVLLFVDADSRTQTGCLAGLAATIADSPQHGCFQLRLIGDCSGTVGRAEELRLRTFQEYMLQPDGRIRYLNTAGFAIRRSRVDIEAGLFDPVALRAEDTLLLANLMQCGELPLFVAKATVQHSIPLSLMECLAKDIRSAYLERRTYDIIASKGVRIRVTHRERLRMLSSMWRIAGQDSIGRLAWFVLVARQTLQRVVSFGYGCLGIRPKAQISTKSA